MTVIAPACSFILWTLMPSDMDISRSELLLTTLPLSVEGLLLTLIKQEKLIFFQHTLCSSDVQTLKETPGV